jgi:hypothetical protein
VPAVSSVSAVDWLAAAVSAIDWLATAGSAAAAVAWSAGDNWSGSAGRAAGASAGAIWETISSARLCTGDSRAGWGVDRGAGRWGGWVLRDIGADGACGG